MGCAASNVTYISFSTDFGEIIDDDPWKRQVNVLSQKPNQRSVMVDWSFLCPSDNGKHKVQFQHTQRPGKQRTRRLLWVDGSEKYNGVSEATSFRIEIDQSVVVVEIETSNIGSTNENYFYNFTIDGVTFEKAYKTSKGIL